MPLPEPRSNSSALQSDQPDENRELCRVLTRAFAGALLPADIAALAVEYGLKATGALSGSVVLISSDATALEIVHAGGYAAEPLASSRRFPLDMPMPLSDAARTGEPIFIADAAALLARYPALVEIAPGTDRVFTAFAAVPLSVGDQIIGAFGLSFAGERVFDATTCTQITAIGQQIAQALERARIHAGERNHEHAAEATLALLDTLIASTPIGVAFFDRELRFGWINERMAVINGLPIAAHLGWTLPELFGQRGALIEQLVRQVRDTGEPIVDVEFAGPALGIRRYTLASYYPVRVGDQPLLGVGVIVQEVTARKQADLARALLVELGAMLIVLDDPAAVVARATTRIAEYLHVDACLTIAIDAERGTATVDGSAGGQPRHARARYASADVSTIATTLLTGEVLAIDDTAVDTRTAPLYNAQLAPHGLAAVLCVPRLRDNQLVAALAVTAGQPRHWSGTDRMLLRSAADLIWLALERANLQQQALRNERRYRAIVQATAQAIWQTDARGFGELGAVWWEQLTGQTHAEAHGDGWINALHATDRARVRLAWIEALATEANLTVEYRVRTRAGDYRNFVMRGVALRDPHGQTREWIGTFTDTTDQKRDEIARRLLADVSSILATTLDEAAALSALTHYAVPEFADLCAIYTLDASGVPQRSDVRHAITQKSALVAELQQRLIANPDALFGPARTAQRETILFWPQLPPNAIAQLGRDIGDVQFVESIGLCSLIAVPLRTRDRTLGLLQLAMTEDSRHFTLDDAATAEELARRMALALDNVRLYREAQEALHARDAFLSIAAHELRTPLAILFGQTQLVQRRAEREGGMSERNQRSLRTIVDQATRLSSMISDLLDVSRLESGQLQIGKLPLDMRQLVTRIVEETRPTLDKHTLTLVAPTAPLIVSGDAIRLEQVLQNLLSNALKYSPDGGDIHVLVEKSASHVLIAVRDHGIGIPEDALPQLFTRFFRAPNAERKLIGGVGIGLYVVREIALRHGGTITVQSAEGKGSTFTLELPLVA